MSNINQDNSVQTLPLEKQPNIPKELQGLVIEQGTHSELSDSRYLLSFSFDGQIAAKEIPREACVMSTSQLLAAINEPNGTYLDANELAAFAVATIKRLKGRHEYHLDRGNAKWLEESANALQAVKQAVQL